jgi:hypothetical protein
LNSGERIPRRLCHGVSEQNTKKILDGIGFLASSAARSFNKPAKVIFTNSYIVLISAVAAFGRLLLGSDTIIISGTINWFAQNQIRNIF